MLNRTLLVLLLIILVHCFIFTKLLYYPYPELFIYPYLTNHGLKPYQEILDQHFPGLMFLPINFDNLGLTNEVIARVWSLGIIVSIHLLLFLISSRILESRRKALLVNLLYLIWHPFFEGWVLWIDSFLPLILLPAFFAFQKKKIFLCGLLLGIGIVFKQTLIPLALLALIYNFWESKNIRQTGRLLLGLTIPIILMLVYLLSIGVLKDFWYWTIIFNLTTYAKYGTSIPPTLGFVTRILLVYSPAFLILLIKNKTVKPLLLFLIGSLAGTFDRADFVHFQPSLPFAAIATILAFYQLNRNYLFKILLAVYIITSIWWLNIFYRSHISNKIFFFDEQTKNISNRIRKYVKPEDRIFIFGATPLLYQMSNTLPAGNIFVFQFPWFLSVAEERILDGIEKDKPQIIISDRTMNTEGQLITEYAENIDQYIQKNYEVVEMVGTTSIMHRKAP